MDNKDLLSKDADSKEVLIRLQDVTRNYIIGESITVQALKEINLEIYEGELTVILGASGSGKSTLLNIMGGMDKPTNGKVCIRGKDLSDANEKELTLYRRHMVGFVFQFYNLIPDLTAGENIAIAADLADNPFSVDEVLRHVGLLHKKNNFPSQLSGGEQQRVSIARALVKRPSLLLCDEPTGALDYHTGKTVLCLLEKLVHDLSCTVIIVTHNSALGSMAHRIIKMSSGQVVNYVKNPAPTSAELITW